MRICCTPMFENPTYSTVLQWPRIQLVNCSPNFKIFRLYDYKHGMTAEKCLASQCLGQGTSGLPAPAHYDLCSTRQNGTIFLETLSDLSKLMNKYYSNINNEIVSFKLIYLIVNLYWKYSQNILFVSLNWYCLRTTLCSNSQTFASTHFAEVLTWLNVLRLYNEGSHFVQKQLRSSIFRLCIHYTYYLLCVAIIM